MKLINTSKKTWRWSPALRRKSKTESGKDLRAEQNARKPLRKDSIVTVPDYEDDSDSTSCEFDQQSDTSTKRKGCLKAEGDSANTTRKQRTNLVVEFSTVDIREYPISVCDNPSVSCGIPISIRWNPSSEVSFDLNEYERITSQNKMPGRVATVPSLTRFCLLRNAGYSRSLLRNVEHCVVQSRQERVHPLENLNMESVEEAFESAKRAIFSHKKKPEERVALKWLAEYKRRGSSM
jgi:hypothetical protein